MVDEKTPPNILVVDDSEAICRALRDLLMINGYAVRTAPSGERALQIMESAKIDLILTDLKMSGMSGIDLLKKVKVSAPSLPVIILTGFGDMDSVIAAMRAGVADYLKKPFSVNEVIEVVRRELRKLQFMETAAPLLETASAQAPAGSAQKQPRLYIFSPGDLAEIERTLAELRAQIMAESVLLLEEAGYVIAAKGTVNDADLPGLASLIVSGRMATTELARRLGEVQSFALNYLEGQRLSVYTASLGQGLFLVLVVPTHIKQGAVWLYAKKAATDIERTAARALEKMPRKPSAEPVLPTREELRQELSQQTENVFRQELTEAQAAPPQAMHTLTFEEAMSKGLLGDLVTMMAKSPEPETAEAETPATPVEAPPSEPVETMSFEEAMKLGLLGDLGGVMESQPPPEQPAEPPSGEPAEMLSFEEALKLGLLGDVGQLGGTPGDSSSS